MAVEVNEALVASRQVVPITWDQAALTGEIVQLFCANPANGDISNSGLSQNDGKGQVSYPLGYVGTTEITVFDNHGNSDFGVIVVGEGDEITQPPEPVEPTVPVDPNYGIDVDSPGPDNTLPRPEGPVDPGWGIDEGQGVLLPSHPIVYPPEINPLS